MAVIHHTTLEPTKLELLTDWLPTRSWYQRTSGAPELAKAGGFRLDDPEGEVGIEFLVAADSSGPRPAAYLVPLTYRGAPLDGGEAALIGTAEHGVLGRRWVYDGCQDPVLVARLAALIDGRAEAQAQSVSHTPDKEVTAARSTAAPLPAGFAGAADAGEETRLSAPDGATLRLRRVLRAEPDGRPVVPPSAIGHVVGAWGLPDGARARGLFATVHPAAG
ncbi:maltokinase N-terminal cap-like domain-containing protein [Streptomyces sp. BBFR115]|uniref:maltokinase N-terminal cap-like domain-containing protein n=1 Tax=Streptomyces sp. BBFR115 TaxID=3448173 RepID=UPI003F757E0F